MAGSGQVVDAPERGLRSAFCGRNGIERNCRGATPAHRHRQSPALSGGNESARASSEMIEMTFRKRSSDSALPAELTSAWRVDAIRGSQRPEEFWTAQQTRIYIRIQNQSVRKPHPMWLAMATAVLIFFAVFLIAPARPTPQRAPAQQATIDADQELLLAVERSLAAGTPEALKPLTFLVESSSNHNEAATISHKEKRHED